MNLKIKQGDIVFHKHYRFFGKIYKIYDGIDFDDSIGILRFKAHILESDNFIDINMSGWTRGDLDDIRWIADSEYFIITEDASEKTRLNLLLKLD